MLTIDRETRFPLFRGVFEAHLTIRCPNEGPAFPERHAAERGLKFADIALGRGSTPAQPMPALRASGSVAAVRDAVEAEIRAAAEAGFEVVRAKTEAEPGAEGVPVTDAEARELGSHYYFEHHIKLLLDTGTDTAALARLVEPHSAHLSYNARRVREDGRRERFVTQRCRLVGGRTAGTRLDALTDAVRAAGYRMLSAEGEFVVWDSDESLDDGWITEHPPR
ncbi:hypothetical protein [Streptomyces sp. I05A-00742]|uniref:hypothetical protein n=1 Tax=Streptomyces sp. I05A-00742 TaxID=2732853 RepID=UPI0028969176|nr:hypothetical protein [Streptomyces sp. I05A-00742]